MDTKKITLERVIMVVGFLASLGVFGYLEGEYEESIQENMVAALQDKDSKVYRLIKKEADELAEAKAKEIVSYEIGSQAAQTAFIQAFQNFRNMPTEELLEYVEGKFAFADTVHAQWDELKANHKWISEKRKDEKPGYEMCGYVLQVDQKPKYFKSCTGELKKVYYGKLSNRSNSVFYYRNDEDKPIVLTYLSTVILD